MMHFIGIDPGVKGGIAVLDEEGKVAFLEKMPATPHDLWQVMWKIPRRRFAYLEKVGGYIGDEGEKGAGRANGSRMFTFGQNFGWCQMALEGNYIPYELVTPQVWQKSVGITLRKKEESRSAWKNRLKARAQELFPSERVTLANSDALLIAYHCWQTRRGFDA